MTLYGTSLATAQPIWQRLLSEVFRSSALYRALPTRSTTALIYCRAGLAVHRRMRVTPMTCEEGRLSPVDRTWSDAWVFTPFAKSAEPYATLDGSLLSYRGHCRIPSLHAQKRCIAADRHICAPIHRVDRTLRTAFTGLCLKSMLLNNRGK